MSTSFLLGIDQGTSQTTAVVLDETGRLVACRSVQVPTRFPRPGWVEQDPWQILHSVRQAAAPLVATYPACAAGLDNQGETFILWNIHTGEPLTPAIVWQDKRGQQVCERLADRVDAAWLRRKTGLLSDSYFSAPKLCQVLTEDLPLRQAAHSGRVCFGTIDSWVVWHLTGGRFHVTDASTASQTLLFDIERLEWSEELPSCSSLPT